MPFNALSVSFEIPNLSFGFQKASGLLKLRDEKLQFEFRVTDSFFGMAKSDIREIGVPVAELESVELKKGIFRTRIVLEADSLSAFEEIPGSDQGKLELKIGGEEREDAEKLVAQIRVELSEHKLREIE